MAESEASIGTYEKIDGLAKWFGTSVASAFFASLERCSCVNLNTYDTDDEDEEEAKDRPLMLTNLPNYRVDSSVSSTTAGIPTNIDNSTRNASSVESLPV